MAYAIPRTVPIVVPEYPKCVATHIWEIDPGFFVYSDETENFSDNIYCSIEEAQASLDYYCECLSQPIRG